LCRTRQDSDIQVGTPNRGRTNALKTIQAMMIITIISIDMLALASIRTGSLPGTSGWAGAALIVRRSTLHASEADYRKKLPHPHRPAPGAGHLIFISILGVAKKGIETMAALLTAILEYGHPDLLAPE
jgi:hypothetical protein